MIQVRDSSDHDRIVASVRIGKPCRATVGPSEMIIGGPPLVSQLGDTRWSGTDAENGTLLARNDQKFARIFPVGDPSAVVVFDPSGMSMLRVASDTKSAQVFDGTNAVARTLTTKGDQITADKPALTVTGTHDLVLASVLTAPELAPEVRMLAACERVLVTAAVGKKEL